MADVLQELIYTIANLDETETNLYSKRNTIDSLFYELSTTKNNNKHQSKITDGVLDLEYLLCAISKVLVEERIKSVQTQHVLAQVSMLLPDLKKMVEDKQMKDRIDNTVKMIENDLIPKEKQEKKNDLPF